MAEYKPKPNDKIVKIANDRSTMSVNASLEYWKFNEKKNEDQYKGKIIFSISEKEADGGYKAAKAFVDKKVAKTLMHYISRHEFAHVYGDKFQDFGGSMVDGKVEARTLTVSLGQNKRGEAQFQFKIDVGPGTMGEKGQFKMSGRATKTVSKYISYLDAMQMALEIYDYIRDSEVKAMNAGKALCDKTYFTPGGSSIENEFEESSDETQQEEVISGAKEITSENYEIPFGKQKGMKLGQFTDEQIDFLVNNLGEDDELKRELKYYAKLEKERRERMQQAM